MDSYLIREAGVNKWLRGLLEVSTFSDAEFFHCNIFSVVIMQWGGTYDQNHEIVLGLVTPSEQVGFIKQMEQLFFTCKRIIHLKTAYVGVYKSGVECIRSFT